MEGRVTLEEDAPVALHLSRVAPAPTWPSRSRQTGRAAHMLLEQHCGSGHRWLVRRSSSLWGRVVAFDRVAGRSFGMAETGQTRRPDLR